MLAIAIFMVLPYGISNLFRKVIPSYLVRIILEGVIRIAIFVAYIWLISRMEDIRRLYQYHGAEHKCINCIEHGLPLTVENVRVSSKEHKRCGTSFLMFVMIVGIVLLFFVKTESHILRVVIRIALLPIIAGISYEIIRVAGSSDHPVVNFLSKPGLMLQRLTTKEPDDSMIEVAIASVEAVFDWRAYLMENFPSGPADQEEKGEGMTYREVWNWGKEILRHAGIPEADLDAWFLLEYVTGMTKTQYYVRDQEEMDSAKRKAYEEYIKRRGERIPLQHITGVQEFMGYPFAVDETVLIPRQDTEILVEEADRVARQSKAERILDVCTGSGCVLLSLLKMDERRRGVGSDLSGDALKVAEMNREKLGISKERCTFFKSDLFEKIEGDYDLIVSNPPYIRTEEIEKLQEEVRLYDPYEALDGKEDGLYFYRRMISEAELYLRKGGSLLFEIGYDQAEEVSGLFKEAGFEQIRVKKDLAGLDRVVGGVYNKARENEEELTNV